jgi:hypothetical protein
MRFGQKDRAMQLTVQNCSSDIITCSREQMRYRKFIPSHNTKHSLGFSSCTRLWQSAWSNTAFLLHVRCSRLQEVLERLKSVLRSQGIPWTSPICGSCHSDFSWLPEFWIFLCQDNRFEYKQWDNIFDILFGVFSLYSRTLWLCSVHMKLVII